MNKIIKNIIMNLIITVFIITSFLTLKTAIDSSKVKRSIEIDNSIYERNIPLNDNVKDSSLIYYVLFSIQILVISIIFIYLIMSNFNIKTIKETFSNNNLILYIASVLLLFSSITLIGIFTTGKIIHDNKYDIKEIEV